MAILEYVEDVALYFRELTDEPDQGFMTDAVAQTWLQIGYDHYYQYMVNADPERFIATHLMTLADVRTYSLSGILLGAAAPNRLYQLVRVVNINTATGQIGTYMYPVSSREELDSIERSFNMVLLSAEALFFSANQSGDYRIDYVPVSQVDWTQTTVGDNEWIDDLIPFHDMIALYAALQYFASAGYSNPLVEQLIVVRQQAYKAHLQRSRSINAARYVHDDNPYW